MRAITVACLVVCASNVAFASPWLNFTETTVDSVTGLEWRRVIGGTFGARYTTEDIVSGNVGPDLQEWLDRGYRLATLDEYLDLTGRYGVGLGRWNSQLGVTVPDELAAIRDFTCDFASEMWSQYEVTVEDGWFVAWDAWLAPLDDGTIPLVSVRWESYDPTYSRADPPEDWDYSRALYENPLISVRHSISFGFRLGDRGADGLIDHFLVREVQPVPEPTTWALLSLSLLGGLFARRRRKLSSPPA